MDLTTTSVNRLDRRVAAALVFANAAERGVAARAAELEEANRELRAENARLRALAHSVAHDLRAPLRAIGAFGSVVAEDHATELDDEARLCVERIRDAAGHGGKIIDSLLALGGVSTCELEERPVDLGELAAEVIGELRAGAPEREVELVVGEDLGARADAGLMGALLQNLIGNSFKFTADEDHGRIELGLERDAIGQPIFFVRDNGAGFDAAGAERMFEPFQRLRGSKRFAGTGIGLATVASVVRRYEGRVWAEGAPGEGATIYFTLPLATRSDASMGRAAA